MKKVLIVLLAVILLSAGSVFAAQGLTGKGVKVGLNMATVGGDDVEDAKNRIGFALGGFITYSINDMIAIQPELLYTMKGSKDESEETIFGVTVKNDVTMKLNYLEIPILVKYNIPMQGSVKPNIFLGPAIGILLSANVEGEVEAAGVTTDVDQDIKDNLKSTDIGVVVGAGVDIAEVGPGKVVVDVRYDLGLTSIDDSGADADVKNRTLSLMVGYAF